MVSSWWNENLVACVATKLKENHAKKVICAMPQYDDSFLFDCEKKRNARSYKPCKAFAISIGNDFTDSRQDNGTIDKWRKKYFTIKRNASRSPSPMPVYRSMHTLADNSTFNCKFLQAPLPSIAFIHIYNSLIRLVFLWSALHRNRDVLKCISCANASLDSVDFQIDKKKFKLQFDIDIDNDKT